MMEKERNYFALGLVTGDYDRYTARRASEDAVCEFFNQFPDIKDKALALGGLERALHRVAQIISEEAGEVLERSDSITSLEVIVREARMSANSPL